MSWPDVGLAAGILATTVFIASTLPMLLKAAATRDLRSYSGASLAMVNVGNLAQAVYVVTLPVGPLWLLHGFHLVTSALMLRWWLQGRSQHPLGKATLP